MGLPLLDSDAQVLETPEGDILYWVQFPEGFTEQYTRGNGNTTTVFAIVDWDNASTFKRYMLGYTTGTVGDLYFNRFLPKQCPWAENQWCTQIESVDVGNWASDDTDEGTTFSNDLAFEDWPRCGWIKYKLSFTSLNYKLLPDEDIAGSKRSDAREMGRYLRRTERTLPKERRVPGHTFETDEPSPLAVAEVGFFPIYEKELVYTWLEVPAHLKPLDEPLLVCLNNAEFDGYPIGTILYKGVAGEQEPYVGPNGELYFDVPYLFGYRPTGWNNFPIGFGADGGPVYKRLRQKGAATGTKPPYKSADLGMLFKPRQT